MNPFRPGLSGLTAVEDVCCSSEPGQAAAMEDRMVHLRHWIGRSLSHGRVERGRRQRD